MAGRVVAGVGQMKEQSSCERARDKLKAKERLSMGAGDSGQGGKEGRGEMEGR